MTHICQVLYDIIFTQIRMVQKMIKIKRTENDTHQPIVKPCYIDVNSIWARRGRYKVSDELNERLNRKLKQSDTCK